MTPSPVGMGGLRVRADGIPGPENEWEAMSKKLFVGGLSWGTTDESLREAFERFGPVTEAKVITDRDTGRSRGFGFVTFAEAGAADAAISDMDGQSLDGREIRVNEAHERGPRGAGGGRAPRNGGRRSSRF
jgi:RNA recognition motif-containing protein